MVDTTRYAGGQTRHPAHTNGTAEASSTVQSRVSRLGGVGVGRAGSCEEHAWVRVGAVTSCIAAVMHCDSPETGAASLLQGFECTAALHDAALPPRCRLPLPRVRRLHQLRLALPSSVSTATTPSQDAPMLLPVPESPLPPAAPSTQSWRFAPAFGGKGEGRTLGSC